MSFISVKEAVRGSLQGVLKGEKHFKVYFPEYFKVPLKNHPKDFNLNAFRDTFRNT